MIFKTGKRNETKLIGGVTFSGGKPFSKKEHNAIILYQDDYLQGLL